MPKLNLLLKNYRKLVRFGQIGEISPNLLTLMEQRKP